MSVSEITLEVLNFLEIGTFLTKFVEAV